MVNSTQHPLNAVNYCGFCRSKNATQLLRYDFSSLDKEASSRTWCYHRRLTRPKALPSLRLWQRGDTTSGIEPILGPRLVEQKGRRTTVVLSTLGTVKACIKFGEPTSTASAVAALIARFRSLGMMGLLAEVLGAIALLNDSNVG